MILLILTYLILFIIICFYPKHNDKFFEIKDISLIILDVMMPKMDGWQVCKEIREYSKVPIIMLTAKGEERDELLQLRCGFRHALRLLRDPFGGLRRLRRRIVDPDDPRRHLLRRSGHRIHRAPHLAARLATSRPRAVPPIGARRAVHHRAVLHLAHRHQHHAGRARHSAGLPERRPRAASVTVETLHQSAAACS